MNARDMSIKAREYLEKADAFWLYFGKPRADAPHVILASGQHSNGYVNVGSVLKEYPELRRELASIITRTLRRAWNGKVDRVVGSDTSSTDLARDVAELEKAEYIRMIKTEDEHGKRQVWSKENLPLQDGEIILQVEDVITTSQSALAVREGIRLANSGVKMIFAPLLPVVVERSDPSDMIIGVEESIIFGLLLLPIKSYEPVRCRYCAAGSIALDAKKNWNELISTSTPNIELGGVKWR